MNESAPQLHQTPTDIENRQMLEVSGHVLEVRPDTTGKDRFYEASPDGKLARISEAQFDELASNQIATDEADAARTEREQELGQARDAAVSKMAKALKKGKVTEHSAGPDYIKATGLGHEDVMRLGFKGFADLAEAGRVRQAEQAERKAQKAELAAKRAAQDERNAAAVAWRNEIDDAKAGRAAAADRVAGISYKQKLENGGELGLKRNPNLAAELREAAVAQAETEGYDVSDEKPRYYHVHNPSAAQLSEQAKTVEALKNFYTPAAKPIAYPEDTQPANPGEWTDYEFEQYFAQEHEEPEEQPFDWVEAAGLNTPDWPDAVGTPSDETQRSGRSQSPAPIRPIVVAGAAAAGATVAAVQPSGDVLSTDLNKPWSELSAAEKTLVLRNQQAALESSQHAQAVQPKGIRGFFARNKERYANMSSKEQRNVVIGGLALAGVVGAAAGLGLWGVTRGGEETPQAGKDTTGQAGTEYTVLHGETLKHAKGFEVEYGSGIIREIGQYAEASAHADLSPDQIKQIYVQLRKEFGRDIIDLSNTKKDTYVVKTQNGKDVRLSMPDKHAHWFPGVQERLNQLLNQAAEE